MKRITFCGVYTLKTARKLDQCHFTVTLYSGKLFEPRIDSLTSLVREILKSSDVSFVTVTGVSTS